MLDGTGDFNNDGKTDLIIYGQPTGPFTSMVMLSNGDGSFTPENLVLHAPSGIGDFNGDGYLDLMTNIQSNVPDAVGQVINFGDGTGNFNGAGGIRSSLEGPITDYNNDGNLDLIARYFDQESGPAPYPDDYLGNGTGDFFQYNASNGIPIPSWPVGAHSNVAADFNRDGKQDMAVYDGVGNIDIYLGDGTGNFAAPSGATAVPTGKLLGFSVMDVNGDGVPDIVTVLASSIDSSGHPLPTPNVLILIGNGDGSFTVNNGANSVPVAYPLLGANALNYLEHPGPAGVTSVPASGTGTAAVIVPPLGSGNHVIQAVYAGNGILPQSASNPVVTH